MNMNSKKVAEICGYIGMVLIHSSTLPPIIKILMGMSTALPPFEMVAIVLTGLMLFLVRAIAQGDKLYMISNGVGFFFNALLLSFIVYGA